jgi:hypothetical protein
VRTLALLALAAGQANANARGVAEVRRGDDPRAGPRVELPSRLLKELLSVAQPATEVQPMLQSSAQEVVHIDTQPPPQMTEQFFAQV